MGIVGGFCVLCLYAVIVFCPPSSALDRDSTWGYLGRHGTRAKWAWFIYTIATAAAVVGTWTWIILNASTTTLALVALVVFLLGALVWPIGILIGSMRTAQLGVFKAAVGSVLLLVYVFTETDAPTVIIISVIQVVIHHCIVDGLWAVLTPKGAFMIIESLM